MKTIKKFLANFTPKKVACIASLISVILGAVVSFNSHAPAPCVWFIGILSGIILVLTFIEDDWND